MLHYWTFKAACQDTFVSTSMRDLVVCLVCYFSKTSPQANLSHDSDLSFHSGVKAITKSGIYHFKNMAEQDLEITLFISS